MNDKLCTQSVYTAGSLRKQFEVILAHGYNGSAQPENQTHDLGRGKLSSVPITHSQPLFPCCPFLGSFHHRKLESKCQFKQAIALSE